MKKYSFLVFHREYEDFLLKLRELGMVHIVEREGSVTDEVSRQLQEAGQLNRLIRSLESRGLPSASKGMDANPEEIYAEINEILHQQSVLNQQLVQIRKETAEVMPWGDFSEDLIKRLHDAGVKIRLFMASQRTWMPELNADYDIFEINSIAGIVYFALVDTGNPLPAMDAEEVKIPKHSLSGLEHRRQEAAAALASYEARLDDIAASGTDILKAYRNRLLQDAELEKAINNALPEAGDKLQILEGWIPAENTDVINHFLDKEDVFYLIESPVPGDSVPILLKNKGFASKFEVLGELYSLPSYKELDLTPFFAPFYTIFFGFCLGDAGYGLLMILATLFAKRKVADAMKPIVTLVTYLGIATLVFGFISGTFFGINLYESGLPGYRNLQAMFVANDTNINDVLFALSLILGGIQIVFGMVLKAVNENIQFGFKYALGTIGWIILLVGLATVYGFSSLAGVPMAELKPWLYAVLATGGILVLFLNSPGKSIFMNFGLGLWNSYNMITGVLGDLLSYIRLFALGISSAILGFVFNSLALSVGTSIIGIFFMVIILVIGHSINLFMAGLGSFVHPMRLTFVEFYKNSGFEGGGRKYQPFRKLT
ncbi:MAG TPA: V-type ATPase 116kDa subunit family protein [Lentimicrobium sp.]|nr:V-type ATPase 116kDa subunit family protein [Lentimicrobium sp.]